MVFAGILRWQNSYKTDFRTFVGLFLERCSELQKLDWTVSLSELTQILLDIAEKVSTRMEQLIISQLSK